MASFCFQNKIQLLSRGLKEPPCLFPTTLLHVPSNPAILPSCSSLNVSSSFLTAGLRPCCSISLGQFPPDSFRTHLLQELCSNLTFQRFFLWLQPLPVICIHFTQFYFLLYHLTYYISTCLLFVSSY